jgi:hypothetical protein
MIGNKNRPAKISYCADGLYILATFHKNNFSKLL